MLLFQPCRVRLVALKMHDFKGFRPGVNRICGNGRQLQAQNQEVVLSDPKETKKRLFPLSRKRLKSDQKETFWPTKVTFESLWGSKSLFLVTFESLCRKFPQTESGQNLIIFCLTTSSAGPYLSDADIWTIAQHKLYKRYPLCILKHFCPSGGAHVTVNPPRPSNWSRLRSSHHLKCEMKSPHLVDFSWDLVRF